MRRIVKAAVTATTVVAAAGVLVGAGSVNAEAANSADPKPTTVCTDVTSDVTTVRDNFVAVETAANHDQPDGRISRNDLTAVQNLTSQSLALRNAANRILNSPGYFDLLDTDAHGGNRDGFISRNDLQAELDRINRNAQEIAQMQRQYQSCLATLEIMGPAFKWL